MARNITFSDHEISTIDDHRNEVNKFDDKLLAWINELGRAISDHPQIHSDVLNSYLDQSDAYSADESGNLDYDAQLIRTAIGAIGNHVEIDSSYGEIQTTIEPLEAHETEVAVYVTNDDLRAGITKVADRCAKTITTWMEQIVAEEGA